MSGAKAIVLTPPGRGAIAVLRVEGARAGDIVARVAIASPGRRLEQLAVGQIAVARLGSPNGEEIVVARVEKAAWELCCHGGAAAVEAALAQLESVGAARQPANSSRLAKGGDLIRDEALAALPSAPTLRTAAHLLDQQQGALSRALQTLAGQLKAGQRDLALQGVDDLLGTAPLGFHLTRPWSVTLLGRPNVGKSSLLNALAGYARAITHAEPGTTRDVLVLRTALDGWPCEISDTAGQRASDDSLERQGAQLGRAAAGNSDLVLLVSDRAHPWSHDDAGLAEQYPQALVVHNKSDLPAAGDRTPRPPGVVVSAARGAGIVELSSAIVARLLPSVPPLGSAIVFTPRQISALITMRSELAAGDLASAQESIERLRCG